MRETGAAVGVGHEAAQSPAVRVVRQEGVQQLTRLHAHVHQARVRLAQGTYGVAFPQHPAPLPFRDAQVVEGSLPGRGDQHPS